MPNTRYNKLQLVLMTVKDWGNFLKLGEIPPKSPQKKTLHILERRIKLQKLSIIHIARTRYYSTIDQN